MKLVLSFYIVTFCLFCISCNKATAQAISTIPFHIGNDYYKVKQFVTKDPSFQYRQINHIFQDNQSVVWISTSAGLHSLQGDFITIFTKSTSKYGLSLPSSDVQSVVQDHTNKLWITTSAGIIIYDYNNGQMVAPNLLGIPDSLLGTANSYAINGEKNEIIFYSNNKLFSYTKSGLLCKQEIPIHINKIRRLFFNKQKQTVLLTTRQNNKLYEIDNGHFTDKDLPILNLNGSYLRNFQYKILEYPTGQYQLLAVTELGRFLLKDTVINAQNYYTFSGNIEKLIPHWAAVLKYQQASNIVINQQQPSTIGKELRLIYHDNRGICWIVSELGLFLIKKESKTPFSTITGLENNSIRSIFPMMDGGVLIFTYNGIFNLDYKKKITNRLNARPVRKVITLDNDRLLLGNEARVGLSILEPKSSKITDLKSYHQIKFIYDMLEYDSVLLVISGINTLFVLEKKSLKIQDSIVIKYHPSVPSSYPCSGIHKGQNNQFWITGDAGIYQLQITASGKIQQITTELPQEVISENITSMVTDKYGRLWFGTRNRGLAIYNPDNKSLQWLQDTEGLPCNTIFNLQLPKGDTSIWIGTGRGLSVLNINHLNIRNFYESDGLASNEFNKGADYQKEDGEIWLGGINGITCVYPEMLPKLHDPIQLNIRIDLSDLQSNEILTYAPLNGAMVVVPNSKPIINIQLGTNDLFEPQGIKFRFRFLEKNGNWIYLNQEPKISFAKMKHGNYSLEIQAIEPSGSWSQSFILNLTITPPYYLSYWFLTILFLSLSLVIYKIFQYRVKSLKREFELRRKIADDLHDNLSGKIFVLRALASKISHASDLKSEIELKTQFENTSSIIMRTMRDVLWTLDPSQDKISNLISRVESYAHNFIQPIIERFLVVNGIPPDFKDKIDQSTKQELLYLLQEALTNAVKHTKSKEITIKFHANKLSIIINIHNKFDLKTNLLRSEESGLGLESEKRRLNRLGGKSTRSRSLDEETITFQIPIKQP